MDTNIQHAQIVQGIVLLAASLGTLIFALAGKWLGGVWTTLVAIAAAGILVFPPIMGGSVFADLTDVLRRILIAAIPLAIVLMLLSRKKVPWFVHLLFAVIGPALFLGWVFNNSHGKIPLQDFMLHQILPIVAVVLGAWILIEPIAVRSPGIAAPFLVAAVTGGVAVLLLISTEHLMLDAVIPATAGGAVLAALIAAILKWKISFARGPVLLWLTVTAAFFTFMWFDAETLFKPNLLWIGAAIPAAWIPEIGPLRRLKPWKRELIRCVLIVIPAGIGAGLAYRTADQAGELDGLVWPQSAAPMCPNQMPIPKTINPPTMT